MIAVGTAMTGDGLAEAMSRQAGLRRRDAERPRIKVNLYTAEETHAVAEAAAALADNFGSDAIDCLMVGDSYLMTHLGRPSTRIDGAAEQAAFFKQMVGLVSQVARALPVAFASGSRPWLMVDMPDGSVANVDSAIASMDRMRDAGAEALKIEIGNDDAFAIVEAASARGIPVVIHLGYSPQHGKNRRYGNTASEAETLFAAARRGRDAGAIALVLERVDPRVNEMLAAPHPRGLPVYSIFSGRARHGGQSLNVWDSVIRPPFVARNFPPTATLDRSDYPRRYTRPVIAEHFARLLALTCQGKFPQVEKSGLSPEDAKAVAQFDPWSGSS